MVSHWVTGMTWKAFPRVFFWGNFWYLLSLSRAVPSKQFVGNLQGNRVKTQKLLVGWLGCGFQEFFIQISWVWSAAKLNPTSTGGTSDLLASWNDRFWLVAVAMKMSPEWGLLEDVVLFLRQNAIINYSISYIIKGYVGKLGGWDHLHP